LRASNAIQALVCRACARAFSVRRARC